MNALLSAKTITHASVFMCLLPHQPVMSHCTDMPWSAFLNKSLQRGEKLNCSKGEELKSQEAGRPDEADGS